MNRRSNYLLAALAKSPDGALEPVQIQKAMFLLYKEMPQLMGKAFYKFVPYSYGPFCADIYSDIEGLAQEGLVVIDSTSRYPKYNITKTGIEVVDGLKSSMNPIVDEYIGSISAWVKAQTFSGLLNAIYQKYPDYAVNSVFNR